MRLFENRLAANLDHGPDQTREMWDELGRERRFTSGGTGFFGYWLFEILAWINERINLKGLVLVLSCNPYAFQEKAPHLVNHRTKDFINAN